MSRIPANYLRLLKDKAAMKEFALKPAGLDTPLNRNITKVTPSVKFVDLTVTLWRFEKKLSENTICFRTKSDISKPELKQYFMKLYGIEPKRISTVRFMGKFFTTTMGKFKKSASYKKVYMELPDKVDARLRSPDYQPQ